MDRWLTAINGAPDRGSEYTDVVRIFSETGSEVLSRRDLIRIYAEVLAAGKYWAIRTDLVRCGVPHPAALSPPDAVCLDAVWHSRSLTTDAVMPPPVEAAGPPLPNADHPSDHVPLAALIGWG